MNNIGLIAYRAFVVLFLSWLIFAQYETDGAVWDAVHAAREAEIAAAVTAEHAEKTRAELSEVARECRMMNR